MVKVIGRDDLEKKRRVESSRSLDLMEFSREVLTVRVGVFADVRATPNHGIFEIDIRDLKLPFYVSTVENQIIIREEDALSYAKVLATSYEKYGHVREFTIFKDYEERTQEASSLESQTRPH